MFKGLANLAQLLKQAQEAQAKFGEVKERLGRLTVTGAAGAGLVTVEMNGQQDVLGCRIDQSLLRAEDQEVLEDLVVAAMNDALQKVRAAAAGEFSQMTGGMDVGAMKDLLSNLGMGSGN